MQTKFRFTNAAIKALPAQQREAGATELEFSDTEVIGLKLLSGKSQGSKCSGQLNPDTWLGRFSAFAGGIPSLWR
ncbi:hypothetical protein ACFX57_05760, partial [Aeromonas allosaccharophila]